MINITDEPEANKEAHPTPVVPELSSRIKFQEAELHIMYS